MEVQNALSLANEINVEVCEIMKMYFNNKPDFKG